LQRAEGKSRRERGNQGAERKGLVERGEKGFIVKKEEFFSFSPCLAGPLQKERK